MIDEAAALLPLWMILSAASGFLVGEACGDNNRHRKDLEQANAELHDRLQQPGISAEPLRAELKHQRGVLHDIHCRVVAVQKGLQKPAA